MLSKIKDLQKFIESEIMPNQLKYSLYLVGGLITLLLFIWFTGK